MPATWRATRSARSLAFSKHFSRPGPFAQDEDAVTQFVQLMAQTYRDGALPARVPFARNPSAQELSR